MFEGYFIIKKYPVKRFRVKSYYKGCGGTPRIDLPFGGGNKLPFNDDEVKGISLPRRTKGFRHMPVLVRPSPATRLDGRMTLTSQLENQDGRC